MEIIGLKNTINYINQINGYNRILDTAEKKINELEQKAEQNTQTQVQRYKMNGKYRKESKDLRAVVKRLNKCIF